jgi:hypothetical protein
MPETVDITLKAYPKKLVLQREKSIFRTDDGAIRLQMYCGVK